MLTFTPFTNNLIDEQILAGHLDRWLRESGVTPGTFTSGGVIITGLAAQKANVAAIEALVKQRVGDALFAVAEDPCLESWLAFMGSCLALSWAEPEAHFLNLDIGGGTTNLAMGINGEVLRCGGLYAGARHFQFVPGTYRITGLSSYAVRLLKDLATRARDDEAYLEQQARERARPWRVREGMEEKIPLSPLEDFHPAMERRVLRQMIAAARGSLRGVTYDHVEALRRFVAEAQSGRRLVLPSLVARKEFDWLVIGAQPQAESAQAEPAQAEPESGFSYPVEAPCAVSVPQLGLTFRFKIVTPGEAETSYNSCGLVRLNTTRLSQGLVLRSWLPGDRFQPQGSRKPTKLKELFRRRKIPSGQRSLWPVLESGAEIVWVRGYPPAAAVSPAKEAVVIEEEPYSPA